MRFRHIDRDAFLYRPLSVSDDVDATVVETEQFLREAVHRHIPASPARIAKCHRVKGYLKEVWEALFPLELDLVRQLELWMPCKLQLSNDSSLRFGGVREAIATTSPTARFIVADGIPKSFAASLMSVISSPHVFWMLTAGPSQPIASFSDSIAADCLLTGEKYLRNLELWEPPSRHPRRREEGSPQATNASPHVMAMSPILEKSDAEPLRQYTATDQEGGIGEFIATSFADMPLGEFERQRELLQQLDQDNSSTAAPISTSLTPLEQFCLRLSLQRSLLSTRSSSVQLCRSILSSGLAALRRIVLSVAEDRGGFKTSCGAVSVGETVDGILDKSLEDFSRNVAIAVQVATNAPSLGCEGGSLLTVVLVRQVDFADWSEASAWFTTGLKGSESRDLLNTPFASRHSQLQDASHQLAPPEPTSFNALTELSAAGRARIEKVLVTLFRLIFAGCSLHNVQYLVLNPLLRRDVSPFAACLSEKSLSALATLYYRTLFTELERTSLGCQLKVLYINGGEFHPWAQHELAGCGRVWNFHDVGVVLHERDSITLLESLRARRFDRVGVACAADVHTLLGRVAHDVPLESYPILQHLLRTTTLAKDLLPLEFNPMRLSAMCDAADCPQLAVSGAAAAPQMWSPVELPFS